MRKCAKNYENLAVFTPLRAYRANYLRVLSIAKTPQDKQIISSAINRLDVAKMPPINVFIQTVIFTAPQAGTEVGAGGGNTGVSEATQIAVAEAFGISKPPYINTATELVEEGRKMTTDPETGELVPVYTEDNALQYRAGLETYSTDGTDQYIRATAGGRVQVLDVSNMSANTIRMISEHYELWAGTEALGMTGFIEDVYQVDYNPLNAATIDPLKLRETQQTLNKLTGGFTGYNGEIFDVRDRVGLLRYQARVVSDQDTAYGWENHRDGTRGTLQAMGLHDADGKPNYDIMQAFGQLTQATYLSGELDHQGMWEALHKQFPDRVQTPPQNEEGV